MPALKVLNPANGKLVATLEADDAKSVADKYRRAREAQPEWARRPLDQRIAALAKFRGLVVAQTEALARILTAEVGKPIAQSRNELRGVLPRLDFFLSETAATLRSRKVHGEADGKLEERISHEPLGVIANISAWNYPWFVGSNVFMPALLAGNAVLYKPSEYAGHDGLEIARLMHESGVPADVFAPIIGAGDVGADCCKHDVDGVFFTARTQPASASRAVRGRMVKLQLELGGRIPIYVADERIPRRSRRGSPTAPSTTRAELLLRSSASMCTKRSSMPSWTRSSRGARLRTRRPEDDKTYIGRSPRAAVDVLEAQVKMR
jgi:acyl-CoA reductase-like NAD-dependent aldehyde dehydrogenase